MKDNKALDMFIESIDRKIDESRNVEKTISQLSRLIDIKLLQRELNNEIEKVILSVSNNCVYNLEKLTGVKELVVKNYNQLIELAEEFIKIENEIPVDDIYYTSIGTHFNVRRNLNHIKNDEEKTSMFFISKFKYELENESVYKVYKNESSYKKEDSNKKESTYKKRPYTQNNRFNNNKRFNNHNYKQNYKQKRENLLKK